MIDTDKPEIPWFSWREMKNHTPWGPEWFMLDAQNYQDVPFKRRERYQEGLVGCVIKFHMTDTRWDDNEAMVADANQALIINAPRLYAEVERLRRDRDLLWDAIRFAGTGGNQEEEIAFWHEKLLNMNEAELKEAFKEHYEDD